MSLTYRSERPSKPKIYFRDGFWRVTHMPTSIAKGRTGSRQPWLDAHKFVAGLNFTCGIPKKADKEQRLLTTSDSLLIRLRDRVDRMIKARSTLASWPLDRQPFGTMVDELKDATREVDAVMHAVNNHILGELGDTY